jgi:hypothetical protein
MVRFVALLVLAGSLAGAGCNKRKPATAAADSKDSPPAEDDPKPAPTPSGKKNAPPPVEDPTPFFAYDDPGRWFKASFPWGTPTQGTRTQGTPFGQVTDTTYEVNVGSKSAAVYVSDWSGPQLKGADLEQVATTGAHAVAKGFGGQVAANTRTAFGANATRDVTIAFPGRPGQGPAYFRYLIHGRRLYTLAILIDRGTVSEADRDRFFNSFKILK